MRRYSVSFTEVSVTAQQDLFQLEANTVPLILLGVFLSQSGDVGDAEAEGLSIQIARVTDAVTNDVAEVLLDGGDGAANADLAINETTELTTGKTVLHSEVWHVQNGSFIYLPTPEIQIVGEVNNALVVNLNTTPADALVMSGTCYFAEMGS